MISLEGEQCLSSKGVGMGISGAWCASLVIIKEQTLKVSYIFEYELFIFLLDNNKLKSQIGACELCLSGKFPVLLAIHILN